MTMSPMEKERIELKPTDKPEAYNLYLKGRYFWNRRHQGGLQKGLEYFKKAVAIDPDYALGYAGVADSYTILGLFGLKIRDLKYF